MKIGAFQPFTLTDFPGKVASIVFTVGCNFRCPFCHNPDLVLQDIGNDTGQWSVEKVRAMLEKRKGQIDGVVVTGGEPTVHGDLVEFLLEIKNMGFAVKLDTNGSRPGVLREIFDACAVDFVAMDIKAPVSKYSLLAGVEVDARKIIDSMSLVASSSIPHLFRTTCVKPLLDDRDLDEIARMVPQGSRHVFQPFRSGKVLCPEMFDHASG